MRMCVGDFDVTFHLGDEDVSIVHVERAHTDGDAFVRSRRANALHLGDCYLNGSYPVIDYSNGGSYTGIIAAADAARGASLEDIKQAQPAREWDGELTESLVTSDHPIEEAYRAVTVGQAGSPQR